jgi:hypothetical protein
MAPRFARVNDFTSGKIGGQASGLAGTGREFIENHAEI